MSRKLLVTHHAPDLDACTAVWLLKRFDSQHFADAKVTFVNPGDQITLEQAEEFNCQLHEVTHVDTGSGEFDHHQAERGTQYISATSLVYDHIIKIHPDMAENAALESISRFVTEIDHFGEVNWPEAGDIRYSFMIHELIRGMEFTDPHNDDSQLHFGFQCLDNAYASVTQNLKAEEIIDQEGQPFTIGIGTCLAVETRNDETIKIAQKKGFVLVVKKNPEEGNIRIKARPDVKIDLKALADAIKQIDTKGTWFYHHSGKMLINGSSKHRDQVPSPLTLQQVVDLTIKLYA